MEKILIAVIAAGSAIAAQVLAQFVGNWLGSKKTIEEKWWDRKAETYANIMEGLHACLDYAETHLDLYDARNVELSQETEEAMERRVDEGIRKVREATFAGSLYLSDAAIKALHAYENDREEHTEFVISMEDWIRRTRLCMEKIKAAAIKDLRIHN